MDFPNYMQLVNDYPGSFAPKLQSTDYMDGATKYVSLQSNVPIQLSLTYRVKDAIMLNEFEDWVRVELNNGTRKFKWKNPTNGQDYLSQIINGQYNFKLENSKNMRGTMGSYIIDFQLQYWR